MNTETGQRAFKPWYVENCRQVDDFAQSEAAFVAGFAAGQVAALTDAADDLDKRWNENLNGLHVKWRLEAMQWLRDRARADELRQP